LSVGCGWLTGHRRLVAGVCWVVVVVDWQVTEGMWLECVEWWLWLIDRSCVWLTGHRRHVAGVCWVVVVFDWQVTEGMWRERVECLLWLIDRSCVWLTGRSLTVMMRCVIVQRSTSMCWMNSRRRWILPTSSMVRHICTVAVCLITCSMQLVFALVALSLYLFVHLCFSLSVCLFLYLSVCLCLLVFHQYYSRNILEFSWYFLNGLTLGERISWILSVIRTLYHLWMMSAPVSKTYM